MHFDVWCKFPCFSCTCDTGHERTCSCEHKWRTPWGLATQVILDFFSSQLKFQCMFSMTDMPPLIFQIFVPRAHLKGLWTACLPKCWWVWNLHSKGHIQKCKIVMIPTDFSEHVKILNRRKQERKTQQEQRFHIEEIHKEWGKVGDFQVECGVILLDLFQEHIRKALWSLPWGTLSCSSYHKQMPAGKQGSP